jgi:signal transduction histidine kinase
MVNGVAAGAPRGDALDEPPGTIPVLPQELDRRNRHDAVGAAAVGHDLLAFGKLAEAVAVTQHLSSIALIAQTLGPAYARGAEEGESRARRLVELSQVALDEMRVLLAELRPRGRYTAEHEAPAGSARSRLRHHGLAEALALLAAEVSCDALPVDTELAPYRPRPLAQEEALYRIAQEGLSNVVKHARATYAQLRLASEGGCTVLSLIDDGVGFTTSVEATGEHAIQVGGLGLLTMRERATAIGGTIRVESSAGGGTTIEVVVPADAEPRA